MHGIDISGTCVLLSLFCKKKCYVANIGDSRSIVSKQFGAVVQQLTNDHKPEEESERARIEQNGGAIFRNKSHKESTRLNKTPGRMEKFDKIRYGPHRVNPGGLSLSRSIGDLPSKATELGGNPSCLISCPELYEFEVTSEYDFMVLACDGVWDVLSNLEVKDAVWQTIESCRSIEGLKLSDLSRMAGEHIMKLSFDKKSLDNITVIVIFFRTIEQYLGRTPASKMA
jgi:protein phosphatase 2C family protein 2/3